MGIKLIWWGVLLCFWLSLLFCGAIVYVVLLHSG